LALLKGKSCEGTACIDAPLGWPTSNAHSINLETVNLPEISIMENQIVSLPSILEEPIEENLDEEIDSGIEDELNVDAILAEVRDEYAPPDGSVNLSDLRKALGEIDDLDHIIQEKQSYLDHLVQERRTLEQQNGTSINLGVKPSQVSLNYTLSRLMQICPVEKDESDEAAFITQARGSNVHSTLDFFSGRCEMAFSTIFFVWH
jgi:hypothetical protein